MTHLLALANANAGTADDDAVDAATSALATEREVRLERTSSPDDLDDVLDGHEGEVVAIGGDGSLHAVVASLARLDAFDRVTLGLVPLGTGNDFAHTLELPDDPAEAARRFLNGTDHGVDVVDSAGGDVVINAVHLGVGAEAGARAKPWKERLGPVGYVIGAAIAGVSERGSHVRITVDGTLVERGDRVFQVAVGNGRYVGGGAPLLPEADPTDGLLDVAISYSVALHKRLGYAVKLRRGAHHTRADVEYLRGTDVLVEAAEQLTPNADGELGERLTRHHWTLRPAALTLRY